MSKFNYVTLVNKNVKIYSKYDSMIEGKVKQVFDDVIIIEDRISPTSNIIFKKEDIFTITVIK